MTKVNGHKKTIRNIYQSYKYIPIGMMSLPNGKTKKNFVYSNVYKKYNDVSEV